VYLDEHEISYVPQHELDLEISDPDSFEQLKEYIQGYNPDSQICLLFFAGDQAHFSIGSIQ